MGTATADGKVKNSTRLIINAQKRQLARAIRVCVVQTDSRVPDVLFLALSVSLSLSLLAVK